MNEWKLTDIYKTREDYEQDIVKQKLEEIEKYKGNLVDSSENIYRRLSNR